MKLPSRTRTALSLTTALCAMIVLLPGSARAGHGPGCGSPVDAKKKPIEVSSWTCTILLKGLPLTIYGDATITSGTARVHAWITSQDLRDTIVLECSATGNRYASCDAALPNADTPVVDPGPPLFGNAFDCHFEATAKGIFWCQSGRGF